MQGTSRGFGRCNGPAASVLRLTTLAVEIDAILRRGQFGLMAYNPNMNSHDAPQPLRRLLVAMTVATVVMMLGMSAYAVRLDGKVLIAAAHTPRGAALLTAVDSSGWIANLRLYDVVTPIDWYAGSYEAEPVIDALESENPDDIESNGGVVWRFAGLGLYSHYHSQQTDIMLTMRHNVVFACGTLFLSALSFRHFRRKRSLRPHEWPPAGS